MLAQRLLSRHPQPDARRMPEVPPPRRSPAHPVTAKRRLAGDLSQSRFEHIPEVRPPLSASSLQEVASLKVFCERQNLLVREVRLDLAHPIGKAVQSELFFLTACFSIDINDRANKLQLRTAQRPKFFSHPIYVWLVLLEKVRCPRFEPLGTCGWLYFVPVSPGIQEKLGFHCV